MLRDLKYAIRVLGKAKASTATVVTILALTIGATTAVFTFLDRLLFQPLPVPKPMQLVLVTDWGLTVGGGDELRNGRTFSNENYSYLRDRNQTSELAAQAVLAIRERRAHQRIQHPAQATAVSGNFFSVLGVPPNLGRLFNPADDVRGGASHVAVASHSFWRKRYNQAPGALASIVYLNKVPFTIVGVLPAGFYGIHKGDDPDLYVPFGSLPELFSFDPLAEGGFMEVFGRLKPGVSAIQAQSNLQVLWEQYLTARIATARDLSPKFAGSLAKEFSGARIELQPGAAGYAGTEGEKRRSLFLLSAIVGLLLLVGSANVACLMIARGVARRREISIRFSLGASKTHILRQSLTESCLLSLLGGAAGLAVAFWADRLLLIAFEWKERPINLSPDWRVLTFGLGVSLATGILVGLRPALQQLRGGRVALNQESTAPRLLSGKALVVVEIALSLMMVAGALGFARSFQNLRSVPAGFSSEHVAVIRLASGQDPDEERAAPVREALGLVDSLRRAPGVESAGLSDFVAFNDSIARNIMTTPGVPVDYRRGLNAVHVDQGYFNTLRIHLLAGRPFEARDDDRAPKVAILNQRAARRFFPNQNPVGHNILLGSTAIQTQVVGVVNDTKSGSLAEAAPETIYLPLLQVSEVISDDVIVQIRSSLGPATIASLLQSRIRAGHLPVTVQSASTLEDEIAATLHTDRLRMQASSLFGALALLLIVVGLYGLMAYSVVRRTREIGIRMAVGSAPVGIVRLVLNESMRLVLLGVMVGIPGAVALMKATSSMLFGLSPVDPASLALAAFVLAITGIAASAAPAWRAAHLDPMSALRVE
ncbi:MAG: ABC transporter permease [Bryobacteraceae bacterium]|jgi:predicted permease